MVDSVGVFFGKYRSRQLNTSQTRSWKLEGNKVQRNLLRLQYIQYAIYASANNIPIAIGLWNLMFG